jgi:Zn-finger nucleic acid-binding protein
MYCPLDGETLMMSERAGVEIDYCPKCRGIWLDRGELDKILAYKAPDARAPSPVESRASVNRDKDHNRERDRDDDSDDDNRKRKRDKSSRNIYSKRKDHIEFIKDIFDF